MRSYAASYRADADQGSICRPRCPSSSTHSRSMPTLALIGAIVAEFFGTPTHGIGFRISTEAGAHGASTWSGRKSRRGACRNGVLWRCRAGRTRDHVLASVVSDLGSARSHAME